MSVPECKRGEGKFELLIKARNLTTYTLRICTNDSIFLLKYQNAITNDIIRCSKDIFVKCFTANNVKITSDGDWIYERRKLQEEACEYCNTLLALIQIAQQVFHLKTKRIEYWGRMIIEVRNGIMAWMESDRKRNY